MKTVIVKRGKEIRNAFPAEMEEEITFFEMYLTFVLKVKELEVVSDSQREQYFEDYFVSEGYKNFLKSAGKIHLLE
ncbi:hypothetical protein RZN25_02740 [Bacillaceae bacterium S4-13-56]